MGASPHMIEKPVVIVTGSSRGIGASVARHLGQMGLSVTVVARNAERLIPVAADIDRLGGKALPLPADVADPDSCLQIIEKTIDRFGRLDALVNNAAVVEPLQKIASADIEKWRYSISVNLLGPFYLVRAAVPELRKQNGRIIHIGSGAAEIPIQAASAYCVSKAALNHFSRILAKEEPEITSVTVSPGVVDTDMQTYLRKEGPRVMPAEQYSYYDKIHAEGELTAPEVPAQSIAWLALYAPHTLSGQRVRFDDSRINPSSQNSY